MAPAWRSGMSGEWLKAFAQREGLSPDATLELSEWMSGGSTRDVGALPSSQGEEVEPPEAPASEPDPDGPRITERYVDLGPLGEGGMGVVRRVHDRRLKRTSAMKLVRAGRATTAGALARFRAEAEVTAQLEHPAIIPVHDFGELPDGRLFFVMKEVEGETLEGVVRGLHSGAVTDPWTFRRTLDALARIADAVAYAHDRGVIHRDLKPSNIMLGRFGEVLLLDWGLAAIRAHLARVDATAHGPTSVRPGQTRQGTVAGTPAYMAPEQARGEVAAIGPATDVYALGATLGTLLSGRPPFVGDAAWITLQIGTQPPHLRARLGDVDLVDLARQAMSPEAAERGTASELAASLRAWLDGAQRRDRASALVSRAAALHPEIDRMKAQAAGLRERADAALADVATFAPPAAKLEGWGLADEASALVREARIAASEVERHLHGALSWSPDLPDAHAALAEVHRGRHAAAEARGDDVERVRAEALLRAHTDALPAHHPERASLVRYLDGAGVLCIRTEPPSRARLFRLEERARRLIPEFVEDLGDTPIIDKRLPMGSYLVELRADGHHTVRYPVHIARNQRWDGVPPGAREPVPIRLLADGSLAEDEVYVPAGPFRCGADDSDARVYDPLPKGLIWLDAFVIKRAPVTVAEVLAWLDAIAARDSLERALSLCPRYPRDNGGELAFGVADGRFHIKPDPHGDVWDPQLPGLLLDWHGARELAAWKADQSGLAWTLPTEVQWEKAARGVDGRRYPWGDRFDHTFTNIAGSRPGGPEMLPVHALGEDRSIYGMTGAAGNLCDWCLNPYRQGDAPDRQGSIGGEASEDGFVSVRGGAFGFGQRAACVANRRRARADERSWVYGVRLARWLD